MPDGSAGIRKESVKRLKYSRRDKDEIAEGAEA
jgi:hypothetical protein